jgi:hypothetical protein
MTSGKHTELRDPSATAWVAPSWLEGARRYATEQRGPAPHHDGTCDVLYPGTSLDRDGRCVLSEGHAGTHVYRGRGPARKPTRRRAYQAEKDEQKRLARAALRRERQERLGGVSQRGGAP